MNRYSLLTLLLITQLTAVTAMPREKTPQVGPGYVMNLNRSALAVVDSSVVVSMQITAIQDIPASQSVVLAPVLVDTVSLREQELPLIFLNSHNQQIYFDRYLAQKYPDAIALRKKKGRNLDINYVRTVKYETWMERAVLMLRKQSCACRDMKQRGEMLAATFDREVPKPTVMLYPVYLVPPADNSVKVREERGSAYLCFELNKWDIKPDYMSNPTELQKIHNSVNLVKNDSDVTIRRMTIEGFASPEGRYTHNLMLSEKRTEALRNYLIASNIARDINIQARGGGENWDGFKAYLKSHTDIPQHAILQSIAKSSAEPDEKEQQMRRQAAQGFNYVVNNVFPALRCTNYNVIYTVRPFTLEESERVFETRPINLNLNEIYRLADKYADNEDKYYSIIRRAFLLYPNDSYINLSMACHAIKKGDAKEAADYLAKVNDCPQKTMNQGLVAYLQGDTATAEQLVELARQQGVAEAAEQLREFEKLKAYEKNINKNK